MTCSFLRENGVVEIILGNDLQPVAVRVFDEVDVHGRILKADAAHFAVLFVCGVKIAHGKCHVELTLAQIVGLGMILQLGQLKQKAAVLALKIDDDEAVAELSALFVQIQSVCVELNGFFQICNEKDNLYDNGN